MTTKPADYDALEKRLRDEAYILNGEVVPDQLCNEAADAIRDLRAERDALQVQIVEERGRHREFERELLARAALAAQERKL